MNSFRSQQQVKDELLSVLREDPGNNDKIVALSNELAKLDENYVRFSVDAGIINRLGKELVGKRETAVSELIKNAYDAEASYVNLVFINAQETGGTLHIIDDGLGMTRGELINGFMRLSSSDKIHNPISPNYKRKKAGQKGIGRFATQRLGTKLTIITQTATADFAIKVVIDWSNFNVDSNLTEVSSQLEIVNKERLKGTTLIIEGLVDQWSDAAISRAYRFTANLLQPESLSDERILWDKERKDPGFKASFYRNRISPESVIIDDDEAFFNHALATIEGYIDDSGHGYWKTTSTKVNIPTEAYRPIGPNRDDDFSIFECVKNVHFKVHYFVYERSLIPGQLLTYVKNLGNEYGGIKLYRNGFRIAPYGEKGDDWLGLDESVRRRNYLFPHQNQSFFGFVEIDEKASNLFEETASREGVIENEAFRDLSEFVYRAITTAGSEIATLRKRKATANQKNWEKKKDPDEKIEEAINDLEEVFHEAQSDSSDESKHEQYKTRFEEAFKTLNEGRAEQKEEKQRLIEEANMLRIFAGLGLVIGEFIHEIKNYLPGFEDEINYLNDILKADSDSMERVALLENNINAFTSYTAYFDKTISRNVHREIEPAHIKERVHAFCSIIEQNLKRAGIKIKNNLEDDDIELLDLITVPMHPSEWASILFNLYTNAKKAIHKREDLEEGEIDIRCDETADFVVVDFSDNGIGVDPLIRDRMFDAFVTTTSAPSARSDERDIYTGTGLGLKIIRDIIEGYNGRIYLLDSPLDGYKTTFRIEIPKYSENG